MVNQRTLSSITLVSLLIFITVCSKNESITGTKREPSRWEILTSTPIKSTVPSATDIFFFDETNGLSLNVDEIKSTNNGGRTWDDLYRFDKKTVHSLVFTNDNIAWSIGAEFSTNKVDRPFVTNSKDRGVSWQEVRISQENSEKVKQFTIFYDICFSSPKKGWIVGDDGILEVLIDGQNMRIVNQSFAKEKLYSAACGNNGEVWCTGERGQIYHFQNGWNKKQLDKTYFFQKVKLIGNDIWLLGYKRLSENGDIAGLLLRSKDKGTSWEDKTPENIRFYSDVYLEKGEGWLVGSGGNIYYSKDHGDSWNNFKSPTKNNLANIFFLNKNNIWIGGDNQTILKFQPNN